MKHAVVRKTWDRKDTWDIDGIKGTGLMIERLRVEYIYGSLKERAAAHSRTPCLLVEYSLLHSLS